MSMKKGGIFFNSQTSIRTNLQGNPMNSKFLAIEDQNNTKNTYNDTNIYENKSAKIYFYNKKLQLYKTEICRSHSEIGFCKYGPKCQFAHDKNELRSVTRHPRYKTETCKTFWEEGSCPYGKRCCFIHIKNVNNIEKHEQNNKTKNNDLEQEMFTSIDDSEERKELLQPIYNNNLPILITNNKIDIDVTKYNKYNNTSDSEEINSFESLGTYYGICKDYELIKKDIKKDDDIKHIDLSSEDSTFINSLFIIEKKPYWETNGNLLWTSNPLFYTNNNHKW